MRFLLTIVSKAIHAGTWGAAKNSHALPLLPPPLVAELFSLGSAASGQNLSVSGVAEKAMKLLSFCTVIPSVVVVAWLPTTADAQTQEPPPVSATVIIRSHRPLSDALDRIQKILLKSINF